MSSNIALNTPEHQAHEDVTVSQETVRQVDIRPIKRLAGKLLPENSTFRHVIMEESDSMPALDYVSKLGTWLSILDDEAR